MTQKRTFAATLCALVAVSGTGAATAQDGVFDMGVLTGTLANDHVRQTEEKRAKKMGLSTKRGASSATKGRATTTYRVEDKSRAGVASAWAKLVATDGLRAGNVADALASYALLNWYMANGRTGEVPRAQVRAVVRQYETAMRTNAAFARLSNRQRQSLAENVMAKVLLAQKPYVEAVRNKDDAAKQRLADAATERFRADMKMDARSVRVGASGFQVVSAR